MRISDWSSDVCSSDLAGNDDVHALAGEGVSGARPGVREIDVDERRLLAVADPAHEAAVLIKGRIRRKDTVECCLQVIAHDGILPIVLVRLRLHRDGLLYSSIGGY